VERIDNVGLTVPADSQAFCHFSLLFRSSVGVSGLSNIHYVSHRLLTDLGACNHVFPPTTPLASAELSEGGASGIDVDHASFFCSYHIGQLELIVHYSVLLAKTNVFVGLGEDIRFHLRTFPAGIGLSVALISLLES
jgi:hypothetical protein